MAKKVVLFASVGTLDIQVLVKNQHGVLYGAAVLESTLRDFHEALLSGTIPYTIDPSLVDTDSKDGRNRIKIPWVREKGFRDRNGEYEPVMRDKNELVLIPFKLAKVVMNLKKESSEFDIVGVVLFNTERSNQLIGNHTDGDYIYRREPIAAGPVLAKWLAGYFTLGCADQEGDLGLKKSAWINYLHGDMISPGPGERDTPINRKAVQLIDKVFKQAAAWEPGLWACISTGGGMPPVKDVIRSCAEYRFDRRIFTWTVPEYEGGGSPKLLRPEEESVAPPESFRARLHASQLIRKGDFVGAYRVVEPYERDRMEQNGWIKLLERTAEYFTGQLHGGGGLAEWLDNLIPTRPRCLVVGMRAEAALTMNRIPEAVAWTCTFFDAALRDAMERELQAALFDEIRKEVTFRKGRKPPVELTEPIMGRDKKPTGACLTKLSQGGPPEGPYRMEGGGLKDDRWLRYLGDYPALKSFSDSLRSRSSTMEPRDFRNINIHSRIEPDQMKECVNCFVNAGLWTSSMGEADQATNVLAQKLLAIQAIQTAMEPQWGSRFLGQPKAREVLQELGIEDAAKLYSNLVEGLLSTLSDFEIR